MYNADISFFMFLSTNFMFNHSDEIERLEAAKTELQNQIADEVSVDFLYEQLCLYVEIIFFEVNR